MLAPRVELPVKRRFYNRQGEIMKRLKRYILFISVIALAFFMIACNPPALSVPSDIFVDEDNRLTWESVERARGYEIAIKNCTDGTVSYDTSRRLFYSLADLVEGDYEIKVRAKGNDKDYGSSDWSETVYFHKDYETGCQYKLINNNAEFEIYRVGRAKGSFTIEDYYRGKPVTRLADSSFRGSSNVEEVIVGNNVNYVGVNAFYNCSSLKKVVLPDTVAYIGENAFQSCRDLTEVNIPKNITTIYDYTFAYCRSLEKIEIGQNVSSVGAYAFYSCSGLNEIILPDSVVSVGENSFAVCSTMSKLTIGKNLQSIGKNAFTKCIALKEIAFADSGKLTAIGNYAFSECNELVSLELPNGLVSLGDGVFYGSQKLAEVTLPDSLTEIGSVAFKQTVIYNNAVAAEEEYVYVGDWLVDTTSPRSESELDTLDNTTLKEGVYGIANQVFMGSQQLRVVTVPDSVRYIGKYAFYMCPNLWKVETSENSNLEVIGYAAFSRCIIQNVSLSEGIKEIGGYAFYGNKQLANNDYLIPESVVSIGTYAFNDTYLYQNPDASGVVFAGNWIVGVANKDITTASCTVKGKDGNEIRVRGISDYAFYECANLQNLTGSGYVRYIGEGAFYGCASLMSVSMNASIKEIEPYTFYNCSRLAQITLPVNLTAIGRSAFYNCEYLMEMDLTETSVSKIGEYAFYNCRNLAKINFGKNVDTIGQRAFYGCSSLDNVVIPDKVTSIERRTFALCSSLKNLTIGEKVEFIGNCAFWGCESLETVILPDSVKYIDNYAFAAKTDEGQQETGKTNARAADQSSAGLSKVVFGKNVEHIGNYAFYGLKQIEKLEIPASVKYIGDFAFKDLEKLNTLLLTESVEYIGAHAFYGCKNLTVYLSENEVPSSWNRRWNSSFRPVVLGCTFSEDGKNVISVTVNENTLLNANALGGISLPECENMVCSGWTVQQNSSQIDYANLNSVPVGTTVYPVWTENPTETDN